MNKIFSNIFLLSSFINLFIICSKEDIYYNHTSSEDNLIFVFTTYRHGARYPYAQPDYFGNYIPTKAALTPYGAIQHLEIGKKYRERYSNFLDMNFNPKQMYIRTSDVERVVISTMKELEGLFDRVIEKKYLHIIKGGLFYWVLYQINGTEKAEYEKYTNYCNNLNKNTKRRLPEINEIFPVLQECFGAKKPPDVGNLCDSVFSAYYQYAYANDTENKIGKCGKEKADQLHKFCVDFFDTFRGWDEQTAYMFYFLFQNIFKYMANAIEGRSELKMVMIGGHDITVDKFMNFLDGLNIVRRTHYPHYACNIVIELRKYNDEFYLEIYYNDILKYNETFQTLMDTLDESKYSNLYNYCGLPPWKQEIIINTTQLITEIIGQIPNTQVFDDDTKKENSSMKNNITEENVTINHILNTTIYMNLINEEKSQKEEKSITHLIEKTETIGKNSINKTIGEIIENNELLSTYTDEEETKNIVNPTAHIVEPKIKLSEIPNIYEYEYTKEKREFNTTNIIQEIYKQEEILITSPFKNKTDIIQIKETEEKNEREETDENSDIHNSYEIINDLTNVTLEQNLSNATTFLKVKETLKKIFKQENDLNLYLILLSIIIAIIAVIFFVILFTYLAKRRRNFIRLNEENTKNESNQQDNNINVLSVENRK